MNLTSCKNKEQDINDIKVTGIYSLFYKLGDDNALSGVSNVNMGDCFGKDEFVNTYIVNTDDIYIIQIYPNYNSSKVMLITGDCASITSNENYDVSYLTEFDITSYSFHFLNEGSYRINIIVNDFTDKFDVIVKKS